MRDPNRPESGASRREESRTLDMDRGSAPQDGYTMFRRRPRVPYMTETVEPERATAIERAHRRMPRLD